MRKILIRFDDICPTMDFTQWERAREILKEYNVKPLIGVIPQCEDNELLITKPMEDYWEYIRQLQEEGYKIAMHGYKHVYHKSKPGIITRVNRSEFTGLSYEEQYNKIFQGKSILKEHGIETNVFFAPSHSYDKTTIKALVANGFQFMSDGKSYKPLMRDKLCCIPCRQGGVPRIGKNGYYTAVFHVHEWVRPEKKQGYDNLKNICDLYKDDIVSFDEYAMRKSGVYFIQLIDEKIYILWQTYLRKHLYKIYKKIRKRK